MTIKKKNSVHKGLKKMKIFKYAYPYKMYAYPYKMPDAFILTLNLGHL